MLATVVYWKNYSTKQVSHTQSVVASLQDGPQRFLPPGIHDSCIVVFTVNRADYATTRTLKKWWSVTSEGRLPISLPLPPCTLFQQPSSEGWRTHFQDGSSTKLANWYWLFAGGLNFSPMDLPIGILECAHSVAAGKWTRASDPRECVLLILLSYLTFSFLFSKVHIFSNFITSTQQKLSKGFASFGKCFFFFFPQKNDLLLHLQAKFPSFF